MAAAMCPASCSAASRHSRFEIDDLAGDPVAIPNVGMESKQRVLLMGSYELIGRPFVHHSIYGFSELRACALRHGPSTDKSGLLKCQVSPCDLGQGLRYGHYGEMGLYADWPFRVQHVIPG
jgi:hypothetical protein